MITSCVVERLLRELPVGQAVMFGLPCVDGHIHTNSGLTLRIMATGECAECTELAKQATDFFELRSMLKRAKELLR